MIDNKLKDILKEQGRKQTWLAFHLDLSPIHINGVCANRFPLTEELAEKIKNLLDLESIEELYKEEV